MRLGVSLVLLAVLAGCTPDREPGWQDHLLPTTVVSTVTDPTNPAHALRLTQAVLPAGAEGPGWSIRTEQGWERRDQVANVDQAYYGVSTADGDEIIAPSWAFAFITDRGVILGTRGGDAGRDIVGYLLVPWDAQPVQSPEMAFNDEMRSRTATTLHPTLHPVYAKPGDHGPQVHSLAAVWSDEIRVYQRDPGSKTVSIRPEECVSPASNEIFPNAYASDWFRKSTATLFHIGSTIAYVEQDGVHVLDQHFAPLATYSAASALRTYDKLDRTRDYWSPGNGDYQDSWYIVQKSPSDPALSWILGDDGTFAAPPGTRGVIPLTFTFKLEHYAQVAGVEKPEPHYRRACTGWLVAYGTATSQAWGLASSDFKSVTPPLFRSFAWVDSSERRRWYDYHGPTPQYLTLERISDGQTVLLDGRDLPGPLQPGPLTELVAAADAEEKTINDSDNLRAQGATVALQQREAEQHAQYQARYDQALRDQDSRAADSAAQGLGPDVYFDFLHSSLASEQQIIAAQGDHRWNDAQRAWVAARIRSFEQARTNAAAQAADDERQARIRANADDDARLRQGLANFGARAAAASSANAKAVQETVHRDEVENYRNGYSDKLPDR